MAVVQLRADCCRSRRRDRPGSAGRRGTRPRPRLAALHRIIGPRRIHRVAVHRARCPGLRAPAPGPVPGRAGLPGRRHRHRCGADPASRLSVAAAAVFRLAVLPLPEAKHRIGGAGRVSAPSAAVAPGRAAAPAAGGLRGHRRPDSRAQAARAAYRSRLDNAALAGSGGLRGRRRRRSRGPRPAPPVRPGSASSTWSRCCSRSRSSSSPHRTPRSAA